MRIRTLVLSSILALAATAAHADFNGPCNTYPANARRNTTFADGTYRASFRDGTQDMTVKRLSDNSYRILRKNGASGIATLYPNSAGTYVLRLRDQRNSKCTFFIATVGNGTLTAYTAYYAAIGPARKHGFAGDDTTPVTELPSRDAAGNRAFLFKLGPRTGEMQTAFTAVRLN